MRPFTLTSILPVPRIGGVLREGLTEFQAAKDPKDKPHHVVKRQDGVDHIISCDPTQVEHPAHLQHPLMCEDGWLWEPWGRTEREGGWQKAHRDGPPWVGLHSPAWGLQKTAKYGHLWVGSGRTKLTWASEAEFQNSVCLLSRGKLLAPWITLEVRAQARCDHQSAEWVSEVRFEAQVKLGVRST